MNTANASGWLSGDTVTVAATGSFADKNAGTGKTVTLSSSYGGADAGNYTFTNQASTTADITPKAITISGITAINKTYDGNNSATVNTANASGWLSGDSVTVAATGTFDDKNAGTGKTVTLSRFIYSGEGVGNYTISDQSTTMASINPKVLSLMASKTYDGTNSLVTGVQIVGLVGNETLSTLNATANDANVATLDKYINQIVLTDGGNGGLASNYALPVLNAANAPVTISKAQLIVTANDTSKTQDGSAYTGGNGVRYTGFVNGESATTVLDGSLGWGGASQGAIVAGTYAITPKGLTSGNYAISYVDGQLVIKVVQTVIVPPLPTNPTPVLPSQTPSNASSTAGGSTSGSGTSSSTSNTGGSGSAGSANSTSTSGSSSGSSALISTSGKGDISGSTSSSASATGTTDGSGSSNVVTLNVVRVATASQTGMIMAFVPKRAVVAQDSFSFAVPSEALTGVSANTPARLSMANGQPLPSWLRFDATNSRIEISAVPQQGLPLQVEINVGGRVSIINIVDVDR